MGRHADPNPFAVESEHSVLYGGRRECCGIARPRDIRDPGQSDLSMVTIPSNFFTTYMPFFNQAASQPYMPKFDGARSLRCVETRDHGMAFMADLFRANPKVLEAVIRVADNSMTMDRRAAVTVSHPEWFAREADESFTPVDVTDVSALGATYAACKGVRVLIHQYATEPNQPSMQWHPDDWKNSFADGEYGMATLLLPATEHEDDAICTQFSGTSLAVPRGCGVWLPCNVMHRGVPTGAAPRRALVLEFVAAGRQHTAAKGYLHADIKDWLFFTKSMLVEHRREGPRSVYMSAPMSSVEHRQSVCTSTPMSNPYLLALSAGLGGDAQVRPAPQVAFEFFMVFWASSEEAALEQARRADNDSSGSVRGRGGGTRGFQAPERTTWTLALEGPGYKSLPFVQQETIPADLLRRVSGVGSRTATTATVGGVYEATLDEYFTGGIYVPMLASICDEDEGTFGPYVGLHDLDDFSTELMRWGDHMDWHWRRDAYGDGDPHGLLREPVAETIKTFDVDDVTSRKNIRIDFVPGALGAGLDGQALPVAGEVSDSTALTKYTSEPGTKPRVPVGALVVLRFRVMAPPGNNLIFSDSACVEH